MSKSKSTASADQMILALGSELADLSCLVRCALAVAREHESGAWADVRSVLHQVARRLDRAYGVKLCELEQVVASRG